MLDFFYENHDSIGIYHGAELDGYMVIGRTV